MPRRRRKAAEPEVEAPEAVEDDVQEAEVVVEETPKPARRRKAPDPEPEAEAEDETPDEEEKPARRRRKAPEPEAEAEEEKPAPKKRAKKATKVSSSKAVATTRNSGPVAGIEGDMDADDFEMPTFKLLHQMSDDAENMPESVGHFVYNKEADLGTEIEVVILRFKKYWKEDCEWDESAPPEEFASKKEAIKAGVKVRPCAVVDLLIPCTDETADDAFVEVGGEEFLMCRWFLGGSSYRKVAGPLMTHLQKGQDQSIWDRFYGLKVVAMPGKGRRKAAVLKPHTEVTNDELRAYVESVVGGLEEAN